MHIQQNIKYLRSKHNFTQKDLAEKIGKTSAAISEYEKGKSTPPAEVLVNISELFNISLDDLVKKDLRKEEYFVRKDEPENVTNIDYKEKYEEIKDRLYKQTKLLEEGNKVLNDQIKFMQYIFRTKLPDVAKELGLMDEERKEEKEKD